MRAIKIQLGGAATPGDVVCVSYSARRGGKTTAGHLVREGESLADVAVGLANGVNTHWVQPGFSAKAAGEAVTVQCADLVEDVTFSSYVEHVVGNNHTVREPGGSETVEITE